MEEVVAAVVMVMRAKGLEREIPAHRLWICRQWLPAPLTISDINTTIMSAPQIPNLLDSLRSGRAGARGRGRGARNGGSERGDSAQDKIVQQTDNDALGSRLSAVEANYLRDPFIKAFAVGPIEKRDPMIDQGKGPVLHSHRRRLF